MYKYTTVTLGFRYDHLMNNIQNANNGEKSNDFSAWPTHAALSPANTCCLPQEGEDSH